MRAHDFTEYQQAVGRWGKPALNLVYADAQGNIGWTARGFAPIRPNCDGLLPVPGDGGYEWAGKWSRAGLPTRYNPPQGYLTTSNEMNLPAEYPYKERKLGLNGLTLHVISASTRFAFGNLVWPTSAFCFGPPPGR